MIEALGSTASIQNELEQIHRNLKSQLDGINRIAVAVYDEQADNLKTFVHSTDGEPPFSHYEAKLAQVPSLRELAVARGFRIIDDLEASEHGHDGWHTHELLRRGYRSSCTTAFYEQDRLFGFLFFDSRDAGYFSSHVVRHLSVYTQLIALLIIHELSRVAVLRSAIDVARKMSHTRNEETGSHLDRMARYARIIARALASDYPSYQIDDEFIEFVFLYAPLHDVGKIAIPERILLKPGRLSPGEYEVMKKHVAAGMDIVETIATGFHVGRTQHVEVLRNIVRYHHEAYDGSGYLSGRRGDEIPLEARIVTVADVFDALTTRRCYKRAWPNDKAFALMEKLAGRRFDPDCVEALFANRSKVEAIQQKFRFGGGSHDGSPEDL